MQKIEVNAKWVENVRSVVDNSITYSIVYDLPQSQYGGDNGSAALAYCGLTIFSNVCKKAILN